MLPRRRGTVSLGARPVAGEDDVRAAGRAVLVLVGDVAEAVVGHGVPVPGDIEEGPQVAGGVVPGGGPE